MIVLVVIVGFPLFGPPRENGYYSFRTDPFRKHYCLIEKIEHLFVFYYIFDLSLQKKKLVGDFC